jgi:hypothetical protein
MAVAAAVAVTLGLGQWLLSRPPPPSARDPLPAEVARLQAQVARLQGELAAERLLVARRAAEPVAAVPPAHPAAAVPSGEGAVAAERAPSPDLTSGQVAAQMDERFYAEPARTAWGAEAGPRALAAFRNLAGASAVGRVECRETMCRIEVTHDSLEVFQSFARAVGPRLVDVLWNGSYSAQVTEQSANHVASVVFYSREGHDLPALGPAAD